VQLAVQIGLGTQRRTGKPKLRNNVHFVHLFIDEFVAVGTMSEQQNTT